ncbi:MAG: ATP-dependent DNA helicase, partial [Methylococcaceae bacterium]|nr:ATP-dependent DNA helicase [Methylococcaceae bacterium]
WPYRELTHEQFIAVVKMLSDGFHTRRGRRGAYLHRDAVHGMLRPRKGARLTALLNGGAIPDQFDYDVILQPEGIFIGTLNEDFAFESLPGDIFQLGNSSYRMLKIEQGRVFVEDAHGQPPNIPFWFGEAPGRSDELSVAVSNLRATLDAKLEQGQDTAYQYLNNEIHVPHAAAEQLVDYLAAAKAALTVLPTQQHIVFERFFDETGDMHFVIHSAFGSRINRAWGLALRKRFCRRFNFELQAAASEDTIVLSLGPTHSFPLEEPVQYLKAATVKDILIQALLAAPMFPTRWRWVANTALAVPRNRAGKKVPAYFQRNDAEDLIAVIFPDQLACQENIAGNREVPDHPLVNQTLSDCLHEVMDIDGLERLLTGIEQGTITIIARDLASPSPLALEILNARPYAFLDDAPAEERRTLAVQQRRFMDPQSAADIGRLNPEAIERVRIEAWPEARTPDELHDA